jgi:ABC-2 type transport system permease protein
MTTLEGTWPLARLIVARDRLRLSAWIAGIVLLVLVTAISTIDIYPTQADLDAAAFAARDNPAALAFNGPDQGLDTIGGQVAFQVGAFGLVMVGLMSVLLVGRVTRGEEDSGRLELVRAMPVGRHAPLAAGLAVVAGAQVVLGALVALVLVQQDLPTMGSLVFGASFVAFGLTFIGITATTAQVTENPRVASGIAGALLGASFAIRAVGDIGGGTLSWLSPMGWAQKARPYAGDVWWPLLLCVLLGASLTWVAATLASHRDFGAGLVAPRPGPATAAPALGSPLGLAIRLHRGAILWWTVSILALGLTYGGLADSIDEFVGDNESIKDFLAATGAASLTDSYLSTSLLIMALLAAGPAIQIVLRLRGEETGLRAEPVLATSTSRWAWAGSHTTAALGGGALALVAGGLGLGLSYAVVGGDWDQVPRLLCASLVYVPAVWLLAGLALALFGLLPRWTIGAWLALVGCLVIGMFGTLLELPQWVMDLSPFQRTPAVPADPFDLSPVVALLTVAAALVGIGLVAFRSRDLVTSA